MRTLYSLGTPRGCADRAQEACLALRGAVSALLHWWKAPRRSLFGVSRPGAPWGPPGTELPIWSPALRAVA